LVSRITVTAEPTAEAPGPTTTHYQQLASDLMTALDQIGTIIPKLDPAQVAAAKFVRSLVNIPDQFCSTTVFSVEQLPELQANQALDVVAGRDTLQFIEAFRPVLDKIDAFGKTLDFVLMTRKAALATQSLLAYYMAKGVARENRTVAAHVANMKRDLGRRGLTKAQRDERKAAKEAAAAAQKEVKKAA